MFRASWASTRPAAPTTPAASASCSATRRFRPGSPPATAPRCGAGRNGGGAGPAAGSGSTRRTAAAWRRLTALLPLLIPVVLIRPRPQLRPADPSAPAHRARAEGRPVAVRRGVRQDHLAILAPPDWDRG